MRITLKAETFKKILRVFTERKDEEIVQELQAQEINWNKILKNKILAGQKSAGIVAEGSKQKVVEAIICLKKQNKKVTQKTIAEKTGLSRQTVAKYYNP